MRREEKLSIEDWERIGAEVKVMYLAILFADIRLENAIGKTKKESQLFDSIYRKCNELRNALDILQRNAMFTTENIFYSDFTGRQEEYAEEFVKRIMGDLRRDADG